MAKEQRLIDANALEQVFLDESRRLREQIINDEVSSEEAKYIRSFLPTVEWARKTVHGCATVEAEPIVHGYWIEHPNVEIVDGKRISNYECSECLCWYRTHENYCGECGAKMDGDRNG